VGTLAGLAAGYLGGAVDGVISRIVDVLLGFPYLIFAIGLMGMMGPGLQNIILALVYKEWTISCRVVRGETLATRELEHRRADIVDRGGIHERDHAVHAREVPEVRIAESDEQPPRIGDAAALDENVLGARLALDEGDEL